ncbi:FtsX-like permease family protein [Paenibacillus sp. HB172176]|uniref:FtsX-like permease family protein n=1 Tax=Paenibacillus sp. HB172176 TaxID=2493690 RepID=UPI00143C6C0B|nr:FtsX-like permease family protein [Paenibacillus sp. HB172176]
MNIVNRLTLRHMKHNKRRTLVTIIGVVISVAMITAVATLGVSFLNMMKKEAIATDGLWHVQYKNVNKQQVAAIQEDESTKQLMLVNVQNTSGLGFAKLDGLQTPKRPYLDIQAYNTAAFENYPFKVDEGRLPETPEEIVLSNQVAVYGGVTLAIGDQIEVEAGYRYAFEGKSKGLYLSDTPLHEIDGEVVEELKPTVARTYTIVGIIEQPSWTWPLGPSYAAYTYFDESMMGPEDHVQASVVLNKLNDKLFDHALAFGEDMQLDSTFILFNNNLLRYYGLTNNDGLQSMLTSLSVIIISIIIIGSVALIYNAFAISVSERSRHLGMLSSVGATNRQKRNSVFFEGVVIGLIAIPLGFICGLIGIGITFFFINSMIQNALGVTAKLTVTVTPWSIAIACLVSILTLFISTYIPARKASRISAIDAIRQSQDVKLTGRKVRTSKLVRLLFGIESEIGLKNMKRNKRRYQATIFSLVISIILFMSVSVFTDNLKKSVRLSQDNANYDIQITVNKDEAGNAFLDRIRTMDEVKNMTIMMRMDAYAWFDQEQIADELQEEVAAFPDRLENGKMQYNIVLHSLDDASLKAYAEQTDASYDQLMDTSNPSAIVIDTIKYRDDVNRKFIVTEAVHQKVGNQIQLFERDFEGNNPKDISPIGIEALTDQLPMGIVRSYLGSLDVVVSEPVLKAIAASTQTSDEDVVHFAQSIYVSSSKPIQTQQDIEQLKQDNIYVYNVYQSRQRDEQTILLMSVFTYGFILLITAISVANIFNTISTSIALRKREFAMLRSVGMTPKSFNKMINYESIFYGVKALLYGIPLSIIVMILIHRAMMNSFSFSFELPWMSLLIVVVAVFFIVGSAMVYASAKVRKERIIDALKQENI